MQRGIREPNKLQNAPDSALGHCDVLLSVTFSRAGVSYLQGQEVFQCLFESLLQFSVYPLDKVNHPYNPKLFSVASEHSARTGPFGFPSVLRSRMLDTVLVHITLQMQKTPMSEQSCGGGIYGLVLFFHYVRARRYVAAGGQVT